LPLDADCLPAKVRRENKKSVCREIDLYPRLTGKCRLGFGPRLRRANNYFIVREQHTIKDRFILYRSALRGVLPHPLGSFSPNHNGIIIVVKGITTSLQKFKISMLSIDKKMTFHANQ
jgi:hypothetical protein